MAEDEGFQVSGQANNAPDGVTCRIDFKDPNDGERVVLSSPVSVSGQRYSVDIPQSVTQALPDSIYADIVVTDASGNTTTRRLKDGGVSLLSRIPEVVEYLFFVESTFSPASATEIDAVTDYTENRDHRYRFREVGSTTDQFSTEDTTTSYSRHTLGLTGLEPDTDYHIWTQTRNSSSNPWFDVSGPYTESTLALPAAGTAIAVDLASVSITNGRDNSEVGTWEGTAGYVAPRPEDTGGVMKIAMHPESGTALGGSPNDGHYGADRKYPMPEGMTEGYFSYQLRAGTDCTAANMAAHEKGPGPASLITGEEDGGQGGLWAGKDLAFSCRGGISEEGTGYPGLTMFNEIYSYQSDNFKGGATIANHPSNDPGNQYPFASGLLCNGKTYWSRQEDPASGVSAGHSSPHASTSLNDFNWHRCVDYIKINDVGQNNGIFRRWFDGVLCLEITGQNFSDAAALRRLCFWVNFYHGGGDEATGLHHFFIAHLNYCEGSVDNTVPYNDMAGNPMGFGASVNSGAVTGTWSHPDGNTTRQYALHAHSEPHSTSSEVETFDIGRSVGLGHQDNHTIYGLPAGTYNIYLRLRWSDNEWADASTTVADGRYVDITVPATVIFTGSVINIPETPQTLNADLWASMTGRTNYLTTGISRASVVAHEGQYYIQVRHPAETEQGFVLGSVIPQGTEYELESIFQFTAGFDFGNGNEETDPELAREYNHGKCIGGFGGGVGTKYPHGSYGFVAPSGGDTGLYGHSVRAIWRADSDLQAWLRIYGYWNNRWWRTVRDDADNSSPGDEIPPMLPQFPRAVSEALIIPGQDQHFKMRLKVNTRNEDGSVEADGTVKAWLDGELFVDQGGLELMQGVPTIEFFFLPGHHGGGGGRYRPTSNSDVLYRNISYTKLA